MLLEEPLAGLPRIYGVAWAFVAHNDSAFDEDTLVHFLNAYQEACELRLSEKGALPTTLRVVLIENLRRLAEEDRHHVLTCAASSNAVFAGESHALEHRPIRMPRMAADDNVTLYRTVDYGNLVRFHALDDRQYRDEQACSPAGHGAGYVDMDGYAERLLPNRTMLGRAQEQWLARSLSGSRARWHVVTQQTLMAQAQLGGKVWVNGWDGYPAARRKLLSALAQPSWPQIAADRLVRENPSIRYARNKDSNIESLIRFDVQSTAQTSLVVQGVKSYSRSSVRLTQKARLQSYPGFDYLGHQPPCFRSCTSCDAL